jgi:hypothetical protein
MKTMNTSRDETSLLFKIKSQTYRNIMITATAFYLGATAGCFIDDKLNDINLKYEKNISSTVIKYEQQKSKQQKALHLAGFTLLGFGLALG